MLKNFTIKKLVALSVLLFCISNVYGQSLPIDFEADVTTENFVDFDGGMAAVISNPQESGINTSGMVAQIIKNGGQIWGGSKIDLVANLDFSTNNLLKMKVFTTAPVGTTVKFKLEGTGFVERDVFTTVSGEWEELTWDFSGSPANFNSLVFMFDFGNVGDGSETSTFLFDDVVQASGETEPTTGSQIDLPVTFEDSEIDYTVIDFGGNASSLVTDPTDADNMVIQTIKTTAGETWAGTTIGTPEGFATNIPITLEDSKMSVRVWSPDNGTPIRLKIEDANEPTHTCEAEVNTTVAGDWETIEFDFNNQAPGTELLSVGLGMGWVYNKASIFFNFGTLGVDAGEKMYYFDDVKFGGGGTTEPVGAQIDLPVTFEGDEINYNVTDFGGNASSLVADPTDASNMVIQSIKTEAAELWAGTTIGTPDGFATNIPISVTDSKMTVRVWSPDSGTPVLLKIEDANDGTHSCETLVNTAVVGDWEVMEFDFNNHAPDTESLSAGLEMGWVYNKASIFFNFGTTGADAGEKTYYFDDVMFGRLTSSNSNLVLEGLTVTHNFTNNEWTINSDDTNITLIEIYNVEGKLVQTIQPNNNAVTINSGNFAKGIYVAKVATNNATGVVKLMK